CSENKRKVSLSVKKMYEDGVRISYLGSVPAWNKGITKDKDPRIAKYAEKNSIRLLGKPGHKHTEESKQKIRKSKQDLYASGWEPVCGRCKKYPYQKNDGEIITVDGTWELRFCKYLDAQNLTWRRNKKRFPYIKPNGIASTYQPDFYVEEWQCYVEIKGYETELDRCKWSCFTEPLKILRKNDILLLM
ncbi:MAG TPA: hypothetical protein VIY47_02125, partial [Ignavibacteriaceae bacterium]